MADTEAPDPTMEVGAEKTVEEESKPVPQESTTDNTTSTPAPQKATIETYTEDLRVVVDRVTRGSDAVEFAASFWEKLARIEQTYAESVVALCDSRTAKLTRMFGNQSTEHNVTMETAWNTYTEELKAQAAVKLEGAKTLRAQSHNTLNNFSKVKIPPQSKKAMLSRRVVQDLKAERTKLGYGLLKYRKLSRDAYDQVLLYKASPDYEDGGQSGDMIRTELERAREAELYKVALKQYEKIHDQTFNAVLPGLIADMESVERERIEAFKTSIQTGIKLACEMAGAVQYPKSLEALTTVQDNQLTTNCKFDEIPPPPVYYEPTLEQLYPSGVPVMSTEPPASMGPTVTSNPAPSASDASGEAQTGSGTRDDTGGANDTAPKMDEEKSVGSMISSFFKRIATTVKKDTPDTKPDGDDVVDDDTATAALPADGDTTTSSESADTKPEPAATSSAPTDAETPEDPPTSDTAETVSSSNVSREVSDESRQSSVDAQNVAESDERSAAAAQASADLLEKQLEAAMSADLDASESPEFDENDLLGDDGDSTKDAEETF